MRAAAASLAILLAAGTALANGHRPAGSSCSARTSLAASDSIAAPAAPAPAESARVVSRYPGPDSALIAALTRGGYVLVFRHGKTDWGQRDAEGLNFADRGAQRNLSEQGRLQSEETGRAIAGLHIPVGRVLASPMWRCRDTATLAFGHADTTIDLFQKGRKSRDARLHMLSTLPAKGTNTALITHQDVLLPIMQLRRDELGEGEALIVKPLGHGTFEILAQVTPADWNRFLHSRKL